MKSKSSPNIAREGKTSQLASPAKAGVQLLKCAAKRLRIESTESLRDAFCAGPLLSQGRQAGGYVVPFNI